MALSSPSPEKEHFPYVVVGGGIAGVTCAQTVSTHSPDEQTLLLSASPLIKAVTNYRKVTKTLEEFDVEEKPMYELSESFPNLLVKHGIVSHLNSHKKELETADGTVYGYDRLCICSGASPKVIAKGSPYVLGIRDTETVKVFQKKLENAQRIIVIGNGGIATELVHEVEGCDIVWAIKDTSITSTFIDAGAAKFCLPSLEEEQRRVSGAKKRTKYKIHDDVTTVAPSATVSTPGGALGPDWHDGVMMKGRRKDSQQVHVEYEVEVAGLLTPEQLMETGLSPEPFHVDEDTKGASPDTWPVYVKLTNDKVFGCDLIISATGVIPNTETFQTNNQFRISADGGLSVDDQMRTSVPSVYAAGDVCTADWPHSTYWIQMRLWSQARQMGVYAAQCMAAHSASHTQSLDFCFEMFAHVTRFFNYKVVLLGKFNAQGLGQDHELLLRVTKGEEYVKVVLKDGKMHGALLIGETDLEETFENLILNQMDISAFGEDLLNPNIDIEDFFD